STNAGLAPEYIIAATVATNVHGTVMTSSPGPMPATSRAKCRALVPLLTPTAYLVPQKAANSSSNAATSRPSTNCVDDNPLSTAGSISSLILRYCCFKSTKGTLIWFSCDRPKQPPPGLQNTRSAEPSYRALSSIE